MCIEREGILQEDKRSRMEILRIVAYDFYFIIRRKRVSLRHLFLRSAIDTIHTTEI